MCAGASAELLRPVDGVYEDPKRILAQAIDVARGIEDDGEDGGPTLGRSQRPVLVSALDPGDAKGGVGGADHARHFDRNLNFTELGERVVSAGVIVEGRRTLVGGEVIGAEPVLPDNDGISWNGADLLDEAREVPGDLWIGGLVVGDGWRDGLRFTELVDLNDPRHHGALCGLPDEPRSKSCREDQIAEGDEAPVPGLHASGTDALVPYLSRPLIGRLGRGCLAVAHGRAPKEIH